jgi:hypothetical protein
VGALEHPFPFPHQLAACAHRDQPFRPRREEATRLGTSPCGQPAVEDGAEEGGEWSSQPPIIAPDESLDRQDAFGEVDQLLLLAGPIGCSYWARMVCRHASMVRSPGEVRKWHD